MFLFVFKDKAITMGILESLATRVLNRSEIILKEQMSPIVWHIRLKSDSVEKVDYVPGHFLRLLAGKDDGTFIKDRIRTYSVWNIDRNNGSVDLAVCTHSDGPGSLWVHSCKVGDTVYFAWKKGNFIIEKTADTYIFIGDLSSLGHLYEIRRNLPPEKRVLSLIYSENKANFFADIDGKQPFNFYELPENPARELTGAIAEFQGLTSGNTMAYIGGDSRVCSTIVEYLRHDLHWDNLKIKAKPFWAPGKRGLE